MTIFIVSASLCCHEANGALPHRFLNKSLKKMKKKKLWEVDPAAGVASGHHSGA
jgi:hypothetical protein